ncbi:MAG: hypothetical protein RIQ75_275, partial [Pseudomonadota bacterium]
MSVFNRQEDDGFARGAKAIVVYPEIGLSSRDSESRLDEASGLAEAIGLNIADR